MKKLHMCIACGHQKLESPYPGDDEPADCPACEAKNKMVLVQGECHSTVHEKTYIQGVGRVNVAYSVEALQDMRVQQIELEAYKASEPSEEEIELWKSLQDRGYYGKIRTPNPTEQEIKDWKYYDQLFQKMDADWVRKRYNFHVLREYEPYSEIYVDHADMTFGDAYGFPDWMKMAENFEWELENFLNWKEERRQWEEDRRKYEEARRKE